jgi:hypothetical protein
MFASFSVHLQGIACSMQRLFARHGEPVAHPGLREQDLGMKRIALDLAAQSEDM